MKDLLAKGPNMKYFLFIKNLLLSFTLALVFLPQANANEWSFEELEAFNGGCLDQLNNTTTALAQAFEYCGCSTSYVSQVFTVEEVIKMNNSGTLAKNEEVKAIAKYCNDILNV